MLLAAANEGVTVRTYEAVADFPESRYSDKGDVKVLPPVMVWCTGALVAVGVALTVLAGPLFQLSDQAAANLRDRTPYIEAVLGEHTEVAPERGGEAK